MNSIKIQIKDLSKNIEKIQKLVKEHNIITDIKINDETSEVEMIYQPVSSIKQVVNSTMSSSGLSSFKQKK